MTSREMTSARPGPAPQQVLYGRRQGRRLRSGQRALLDRLLPEIEIELPPDAGLDPAALFAAPPADIWLEIGFGAGEHLAVQAAARPEIGFLGCEPYINGVVGLLARIETGRLTNIRLYLGDARLLLAALPDRCMGRAFVLFPDPWPKTRHHKRRMISPPVIAQLARVLRPGAELRVATDDPGYLVWILRHLVASEAFEWLARRPGDWRRRPDDWPPTRYEEKAIAQGRPSAFLRFQRR